MQLQTGIRKTIAFSFVPLILVSSLFGLYVALTPPCSEYSCIQVNLNSNTSMTGIIVYITPVPAECGIGGLICTSAGASDCYLPTSLCYSVNTQSNSLDFSFRGLSQGYYEFGYTDYFGNGTSIGAGRVIYLANQTEYLATINATAFLGTDINVTVA